VVDDKGSSLADELTNDAAIFGQVVVFDVDAQEVNRVHGGAAVQSELPAASVHIEDFVAKLKADDVPSLVTDSDTRVGECDQDALVDFRWPRDGDVILAIDMNRNVPRRHRSPGPISELEVEAAEVGVTLGSLLYKRSVDERRRHGQMIVCENRPHLTWFSQQVVTEGTVQVAL